MCSNLYEREPCDVARAESQYSLTTMFWVTSAAAILLGYANSLGGNATELAVFYGMCVVVCGVVVGLSTRQLGEGLFWSALFALLAYLAVAGGRLPHASIAFGWGAIGSICGALCGVRWPRHEVVATLVMGLMASIAMVLVVFIAKQPFSSLIWFDIICAGFVGAILRPFASLLQWIEKASRHPRILLTSWLVISVLVGNYLVPILGGVPR